MLGKFYAAVFGPQSYGAFVFAGAYLGIIVRIIVGIFTIPYEVIYYRSEERREREREAIASAVEEKRGVDAILRDGFMADYRNGVDADLDRYGKLLLLLQVAVIVLGAATAPISILLYGVVSRLGGLVNVACIVLDIVWVVRIYKTSRRLRKLLPPVRSRSLVWLAACTFSAKRPRGVRRSPTMSLSSAASPAPSIRRSSLSPF